MKTVIITDAKYRSSIAATRSLGELGYNIILTQTKADMDNIPPAFSSRYAGICVIISGSVNDNDYLDKLYDIINECSDRPIIFPIGAVTLNKISKDKERFNKVCDFIISDSEILDALNDKDAVQTMGEKIGIPTPKRYYDIPDKYPVVIKPHCGEKFGLKAENRYIIANNNDEYKSAYSKMSKYDPKPIVQKKVTGDGIGVSMLIDKNGELKSAICHKRLREYPISGGPSACCVSFYDEKLIDKAYKLLSAFNFVGMAMVEFKGEYLLEVNPRIWGSFPLTYASKSDFANNYVLSAIGENCTYNKNGFIPNTKMVFRLNNLAACALHLKKGNVSEFFKGLLDNITAKEAIKNRKDRKPYKAYLKHQFSRRNKI